MVMLIAGAVTIIFHRFKQPVVLGYIVAGIIIGPHTPPFALIRDEAVINTLAELGIVFLLFSLGLEFSFRKLLRIGTTVLVSALAEIILLIWIGFQIGRYFGWNTMDALFLGAILSVSSTTIIIKTLDDLKLKRERFAQLIFGILIVEDILAIGMIALLSFVSTSGVVNIDAIFLTLAKLTLFIVVALILGILLIPRLLNYVAKYESNEMLLITVLGICFGFCLLVLKLNYSIALGAFIIGTVMAESKQIHTIEKLIEPIRDMFSAIFFVAIGLMFDPRAFLLYAIPVAVITVFVILGKLVSCGIGTFITGYDIQTSMRVGMGKMQIGEFSFIIASLGVAMHVTSDFIYPVTVAVSAVTTMIAPYLIRAADPLSAGLTNALPPRISRVLSFYTEWLQNIRPQEKNTEIQKMIRRIIFQVFINFTMVIAIFIISAYFSEWIFTILSRWGIDPEIQRAFLWGAALVLAVPFLIAVYRKLQGLSMILAELAMKPNTTGHRYEKARKVISEVIPMTAIIGMVFLLIVLSANILPTIQLLILVLGIVTVIAGLLWKKFIMIHARLQNALRETLDNKEK